MKPLPETFRKRGFDYSLIKRLNDWGFYRLSIDGEVFGYEVSKIKKLPNRTIKGKVIEAREALPSDEEFGWLGFSYLDLACAKRKFYTVAAGDKDV